MTDDSSIGDSSDASFSYTTVPAEKKEHAEKFISTLIKVSRRFRYGVSERRGIEYVEFADRLGLNIQGSALDRLFYGMLTSELKCMLELVRFICMKNRHDEIPDTYELLHPDLVAQMMKVYMPLVFRKEQMVVYVETFNELATKICKDVKTYVPLHPLLQASIGHDGYRSTSKFTNLARIRYFPTNTSYSIFTLRKVEGDEPKNYGATGSRGREIKSFLGKYHTGELIKTPHEGPYHLLSHKYLQELKTVFRESLKECLEYRYVDICSKISQSIAMWIGHELPRHDIIRYFVTMVDERSANLLKGNQRLLEYSSIVVGDLDTFLFCSSQINEWFRWHPKILPHRSDGRELLRIGNITEHMFETILKYVDLITLERMDNKTDAVTKDALNRLQSMNEPAFRENLGPTCASTIESLPPGESVHLANAVQTTRTIEDPSNVEEMVKRYTNVYET